MEMLYSGIGWGAAFLGAGLGIGAVFLGLGYMAYLSNK